MNIERRIVHNTENDPSRLARTGMKYFVHVSAEYAASTPAQGLAIAKLCQASGENPGSIMYAFRNNPWYREVARRAAIGRHKKIGRGPLEITDEGLDFVIDIDTSIASAAMVLTTPEIDKLLEGYPASMKSDETKKQYEVQVKYTIAQKERTLRESR